MRAYIADFDKGLPETWHLEPSIIVRTSKVFGPEGEIQKGQALWITEDRPIEEFEEGQRRLAVHYQSDPSISNPAEFCVFPEPASERPHKATARHLRRPYPRSWAHNRLGGVLGAGYRVCLPCQHGGKRAANLLRRQRLRSGCRMNGH